MKTSHRLPPRMWFAVLAGWLIAVVLSAPAGAVEPSEILPDAAMETRAREISAHLRCLVCQNQSIDDSNAPLAKDLRLLVRERLTAGDSDSAVMDYIVARYGDFVLLKPPLNASTVLLWAAPLLCLSAIIYAFFRMTRFQAASTGGTPSTPALTEVEERKLRDLLEKP